MEKQRWEESEKRRAEERRSEKRMGQEKKMQARANVRKVAKHLVFPMICGSGRPKSRLAKAAGAEPSGQMRDEKLHAVVARSAFSDQFWKLRCRKNARRCGASTFPSQNVQNTSALDHFWKLRCRKSAHRCGAKHIWKSRVKMYKTKEFRNTFGSWHLEKMHAVVVRRTFRSQKYKKLRGTGHFWAFRCRFAWPAQGIVHLVKSEPNVRVLWQLQLQPPLNYTRLHYTTATTTTTITTKITLHCATLVTLQYTVLKVHYSTLQYNYTTLHSITLHTPQLRYTALHSHQTTLHYSYSCSCSYSYSYTTLH